MSRIFVITGAGIGLGRALARRFVNDGDRVVLLGRTAAKLEAVAAELGERASAIACDVAVPDSVRQAFAAIQSRHAHIDVLINNAAVFEPFLVAEASDAQIVNTIMTNLTGAILCARAAIPLMRRGSHIVNVSSESVGMRFPHLVVYQSSKAGLERFSEGLHHELEPAGIRVTSVRAGQMYEEGKTWDVPAQARLAFGQAAMAAGINLRERPLSQFGSVADALRRLIDLPPDLHVPHIQLAARHP
ncbi:SDR family oxidoreductase [Sinimarinibacterium thermocellulolyticum]|uniref:SDR family oxidoreductase n=1 Tax=Sinimarinibacterium thermocellulolyticum TaxID=3170016 RepID=A0ABV2ACT3_9GAMM